MSTIDYVYKKACSRKFPLPEEAILEQLEHRLGVDLPPEFRQFILRYNGGHFFDPIICLESFGLDDDGLSKIYGIGASDEGSKLGTARSLSCFSNNDPVLLLPIGYTATGSMLILCNDNGLRDEIYIKLAWKQEIYSICDGIEEFFCMLQV